MIENNKGEFNFALSEDFHQHKKFVFFSLFVCVFKHDDEEMQKKLLGNKKFVSMIPSVIKKTMFCIQASKPIQWSSVNSILTMMKPLMEDVHDLDEINMRETVENYKIKFLTPTFKLYPSALISNDPVSYLYRCGRTNVAKEYMEGRAKTLEMMLTEM